MPALPPTWHGVATCWPRWRVVFRCRRVLRKQTGSVKEIRARSSGKISLRKPIKHSGNSRSTFSELSSHSSEGGHWAIDCGIFLYQYAVCGKCGFYREPSLRRVLSMGNSNTHDSGQSGWNSTRNQYFFTRGWGHSSVESALEGVSLIYFEPTFPFDKREIHNLGPSKCCHPESTPTTLHPLRFRLTHFSLISAGASAGIPKDDSLAFDSKSFPCSLINFLLQPVNWINRCVNIRDQLNKCSSCKSLMRVGWYVATLIHSW